jgi:hypothetical protein
VSTAAAIVEQACAVDEFYSVETQSGSTQTDIGFENHSLQAVVVGSGEAAVLECLQALAAVRLLEHTRCDERAQILLEGITCDVAAGPCDTVVPNSLKAGDMHYVAEDVRASSDASQAIALKHIAQHKLSALGAMLGEAESSDPGSCVRCMVHGAIDQTSKDARGGQTPCTA